MSSQQTRNQTLNSYWVTNSLGDYSIHTADLPDPVIKKERIYARIIMI